ncbi:MAG: PTS lactose/cellobiose transporter subunit IIA [Anaerococcus sp.]|nr:PTS lactose/cellobiose transporter subunit IIA [Anaerococcus sp.]
MEDLEMICFQIISHGGSAKSDYIEAMKLAKEGEYKKADELMEHGYQEYKKAHEVHSKLITKEASGEGINTNLLIIHAEDQISTAEVMRVIASENIYLIKEIRGVDE